jgi:glutamate/tyrosine decarboxylase-like PLP-dependent enzyme
MLNDVRSLSPRYRARYAVILAQLERTASGKAVSAATVVVAGGDAGRAAAILAGMPSLGVPKPRSGGVAAVHGSGQLVSEIRHLIAGQRDVNAWVSAQQHLEQTAVPLHPSRQAHLIRSGGAEWVALQWPAGSVATRSAHQRRMAGVLQAASATGPIPVVAHDEYAVVECDGGDPWVFAPNLGHTLEDRLRWDEFAVGERRQVLTSVAALRRAMADAGLAWQGFAPRNMFLRDGRLVLIDFEEVVDAAGDPARAAECLLWHRIFFADCLTEQEANYLFVPLAGEPKVADDVVREADGFERALLNTPSVTWGERRELLQASLALEGRHPRPSDVRDGGILFGHELGHFWGDFIPIDSEARLFAQLRSVTSPDVLVACLEAFEAAMEADICRSLRLRACGTWDVSAPRTVAMIDTLETCGASHLAIHRARNDQWYERLTTDPGRLVDELLHAAGTTVNGLDRPVLDEYLVGAGDARKAHEESLTAATRIGLDFLHREDGPFLHHREPEQLRAALSGPLPHGGASIDAVLAEVEDVIARYSVSQSHPDYLAFPDSGNAIAALAGAVLGRLLNQNLIAVDRSAPAATFVEVQVIEWLRELVGYESAPVTELRGVRDVAGLWATGGHLSNHIAMLVALGRRFPGVRRSGLVGLGTQPAVVMAGPIAHYSHSDAAFHLGLGWDAVISVVADGGFTTDPDAVDAALTDPPRGKTPFMVVGVAGNCRTTGLDDLEKLAAVCRRHGVWFHVDACHGGSLIFNERLRDRHLRGIAQADSVSLDPHKGLFTPYPSSYVIFRERGVLSQFSRHESAVNADGSWDLGLITPFLGSRGFESLATWMLLRQVGIRRLGDLVESRQAHVRYLERRIDDSNLFVRLNDVDFYRLAFVLCPPSVRQLLDGLSPDLRRRAVQAISRYTSRLNEGLYRSGAVCFDEHTLADLADRVGAGSDATYTIMAACPGNPLLSRADLDRAVDHLLAAALPLVPGLLTELTTGTGAGGAGPTLAGPAGWGDVP